MGDTTASVTNWLLINLAKNPRAQDKLREEILAVCPSGDVTEEHLKQMPYLKACIRESRRLTPALMAGTMRPAPSNMVMAGYEIPEGTLIMTDTHCMQTDPALVEQADEFLPERWSEEAVEARKGTDEAVCDHALLRDSFGMGARFVWDSGWPNWRFKWQPFAWCETGTWTCNPVNPGGQIWLLLQKRSRFQNFVSQQLHEIVQHAACKRTVSDLNSSSERQQWQQWIRFIVHTT